MSTRLLLLAGFSLSALAWVSGGGRVQEPRSPDEYLLVGSRHYWTGYSPTTADGRVHVVVEIPAGSTDKWEVNKRDGALRWEFKEGAPRVVRYLPYPGNYGMIPRTLLPEEAGGDGDPLDVILLGPALPRGTIAKARLIGVLRMRDGGEQDDKLLAVTGASAFADVANVKELERDFPGVVEIVSTWFSNYKGPGEVEVSGVEGPDKANEILAASIQAYSER